MPGFVTHYLFGVNAYKNLSDPDLKKIIAKHNHAFSLGLQGPDIFFYFLPTSTGIKPNISNIMHKQKTGEFFRQLILAVSSVESNRDYEIALAYIQGFMGHYLLDTHLHPYVYSRVGTSTSRETLGIHFGLESDIDREVLYHYKGKRPSDFSHAKVMNVTPHQELMIARLLKEAIFRTYNIDITASLIRAAIVSFKAESWLLQDPHHYKQRILNAFENRIWGYHVISPLLVNDYLHVDDPCNRKHRKWVNPWDDTIGGTASVFDVMKKTDRLYDECMLHMQDALEDAYHFIPQKNPYILKLLGNNSYTSGIDCTIPLKREP